jgi:hypothetical protein
VECKRRCVVVRADELQPDLRLHGGHRQEHAPQLFQFGWWCGELEFELGRDETSPLVTAENVLHPVGAFTLYDRRMAFCGIGTRPERDTSNPTASSLVGISGEGADLHPVSIAKKQR